jgi:hypothetical protein
MFSLEIELSTARAFYPLLIKSRTAGNLRRQITGGLTKVSGHIALGGINFREDFHKGMSHK